MDGYRALKTLLFINNLLKVQMHHHRKMGKYSKSLVHHILVSSGLFE